VLCQITPAGLRILERLEEPMNRFDDQIGGALAPGQIDALLEALGAIREGVEKSGRQE
jgi:hypothetical protein